MLLRAPAKLNLSLALGPLREDGLHTLCSVFQPLSLADLVRVCDAEADAVECPDVGEDNLAARALSALRERGWERSPVRISIDKRIPVAAGLGGGSADAACVLRLARGEVEGLRELAMDLGSDVPSQLEPRPTLVRGAGEALEPLGEPAELACVLIPSRQGLATAEVYREADRLGLGRSAHELEAWADRIREVAVPGWRALEHPDLLINDLEPAALSLRPGIADALEALRSAGAERAIVAGSGPTAAGLCSGLAAADRVCSALPPAYAGAIVAVAGEPPRARSDA